MSTDTIIMVVFICVGAALILAGLAALGLQAWKLIKAGRAAGIKSKAHAQEIAGRVQRLGPRLRELEKKQRAVAEKLESISATARRSD